MFLTSNPLCPVYFRNWPLISWLFFLLLISILQWTSRFVLLTFCLKAGAKVTKFFNPANLFEKYLKLFSYLLFQYWLGQFTSPTFFLKADAKVIILFNLQNFLSTFSEIISSLLINNLIQWTLGFKLPILTESECKYKTLRST